MKIEHVPLWLEQLADTIKREIAEALKQITDTIIRRQTIFIVCLLVLIAISNHDSVPPDGSEREPATPTTPASEASAPTDRALPTPKAEPAPRERPEIGTPVPDAKVDQAARNENSGVFVRIDFRGSNAILNTVRTHAVLYRRFGAEKLPVRKHSVAKRGDNFCTALADEIDKLFLSCPEVTSELWSSLGNQGSSRAITEGQLFSIPNIQVVRYEYRNVVKKAPAEAEATYGKLIHNSMALPVPDSTLLTLTGFAIRIYVSDIALALEVKSAVEAFDLPNTFPQIERSAANRRKPDLFSDQYAAPMDVEKECKPKDPVIVKEAASIVKEAAFWKSLDWLRDWQPPACALHCRSDNECVTINLIDQAVAPHWDLGIGKDEEENLTVRKVKVRIFEPEIPTADVPLPSPERCNVIDFDKRDEHHGTHIASILASRQWALIHRPR